MTKQTIQFHESKDTDHGQIFLLYTIWKSFNCPGINVFWDNFKGRKLYFKKYLNKNVTKYMEQQLCVVPMRRMHSWEFPLRKQSCLIA